VLYNKDLMCMMKVHCGDAYCGKPNREQLVGCLRIAGPSDTVPTWKTRQRHNQIMANYPGVTLPAK